MGWIRDIYNKLRKRGEEEIKQYNNSSGLGEYIAENFVSVVRYTAEAMGSDKIAKDIEENRKTIVGYGRTIDDKAREEYEQYQRSDGFSQYVTGNVVTLARMGAEKLGQDELAKEIENKRQDVLDGAKIIDDKAREEYRQYLESDGFSQYVAGNVVTLARMGAEKLGQDELAKEIENKRQDVLDGAKIIDDKAREEYRQYLESDGFSQYVAGNVVTLVRDGAKAIGKDDWAEMIEAQRQKVLDEAKSIDDRVRQEYEQYKNSDDLGQYLENNLNTLRNRVNNSSANVGDYRGILDSEKSESNKQDNNYIIPEYRQEIERINILNRSFESGNVSIIKEKDEERSIICGMIDGKPHGANIIIGKDGELIDVKLFDHGNEINLEGRELNVSRSVDDLGNEHYVTLLDGKKFGWEIAKDKDGNVESLFYDETGELNIKSVKILEQQYSKQELIEEMKNMQGNLPQLTGQYALSQVKCNLNLHNSHKENEDEGVEVSNSKSMKKFDERVAIKLATSKGDMGM